MALLLHRAAPTMIRSFVQSLPASLQPSRPQRQSSTRAAAAAGGAGGEKPKVVGKAILARRLAENHAGLTLKAANEIVDSLLDDIMLTVAEGETVTIPGFGSFKKRTRAARKGRNPTTGAELQIPEKDYPAFSAGSAFKGVVQVGSWEAYDKVLEAAKQEKAAKAKK